MNRRKPARRIIAAMAVALAVVTTVASCTADGQARADLPVQATARITGDLGDSLQTALDNAVVLSGSSGGVAGVWAPWAGEWTAASGTTRPGGSVQMTTDMHFRAGALTREMTCTVLLKLVDAKVVELDQKISSLLPELPLTHDVSLRQLCQGTSGIADYTALLGSQFLTNPTRPWPPLELISNGLASSGTAAAGQSWNDSASAYILLGMALESATNTSFAQLYHRYLIDPLGLSGTDLPSASTLDLPAPHASGYYTPLAADGTLACDKPVDVSELSPSMGWTAGGATTTLEDLHLIAQAVAGGALVSKASAKQQWETVPMGGDTPSWWSFGLGAAQIGPLRGNASAMPGALTAAYSDPESGLTVVVMLNNSTTGAAFARSFALQLASLASKAAPTGGASAPGIQLPWSADQMAEELNKAAICQPAPEPAG